MAVDMKELMMEKGDQIAIGGAILLLVGYAVFAFGISSDAELTDLDNQVKAAQQRIQTNPAPKRDKADFSATASPWGAEAAEKPAGARNWVSMFKPKVTANVKGDTGGPKPPVTKDKFLTTPVMGKAETELGQVKVKWVDSKVPPGEEAAAISEYEVFRQEAGKGWASLAKVKAREFTDNTVEPKKKYAYKVKSRTKDKTKDGKQETDFSGVEEATVPSGVVVVYTGGSPQAAAVTVRKFIGGQWKERKYTVLPKNEERNQTGDIGKIEREKDPDTGKMVEVDYRTNFVLNEIQKARFGFKRIERRSKIVNGTLETEDVEVDAERDRMKILYTNDEGKPVDLWMADEKDEEPK